MSAATALVAAEPRPAKRRPPGTTRLTADLPHDLHDWLGRQKAATGDTHTELVRSLIEEMIESSTLSTKVYRRCTSRRVDDSKAQSERGAGTHPKTRPTGTRRLTADLPDELHVWLVAQKDTKGYTYTEVIRALVCEAMDNNALVARIRKRTARRRLLGIGIFH